MWRRRFAGLVRDLAVTSINTVLLSIGVLALAMSLAGCATGTRPLTIEEQLYFDKATGGDITREPPGLRLHPVHPVY